MGRGKKKRILAVRGQTRQGKSDKDVRETVGGGEPATALTASLNSKGSNEYVFCSGTSVPTFLKLLALIHFQGLKASTVRPISVMVDLFVRERRVSITSFRPHSAYTSLRLGGREVLNL